MDDTIHWLFEAQKSPEFTALLQLIAENEVDGKPKFSPRTCRDLRRILVCRTYAPALLELCHLITIADACGGSWPDRVERFFWNSGPARGSRFRGYILDQVEQEGWRWEGFAATDNGIVIQNGSVDFTVTYSRMPLLSALVDFLISSIGYIELDNILQAITNQRPSKRTISDTANQLSKQLYGYLKEHLPTAQEQRKFHRLIEFMEEALPEGFSHQDINDALLLNFWLQESPSKTDFRTFPSVFRLFVHLRQTLEQIRDLRELNSPLAIGSDRNAGEVDPNEVLHLVESIEEQSNPLIDLQEPPSSMVKFLDKQKQTDIERLTASGHAATALPLSLMRCEVFEPCRKRLTQALRDKATTKQIQALIEHSGGEGYLAHKGILAKIAEHMEQALMASLYVLLRVRNEEAVTLALALRPDLDLSSLAEHLHSHEAENMVILGGGKLSGRFFSLLEDPESASGTLADLASESKKAYKKIARKGFRDKDIDLPEVIQGFIQGSRSLFSLWQQLTEFIYTLDNLTLPEDSWETQFATDREIFSKQFHILYGEAKTVNPPETNV